jgi:hypothetical protein
MQALPKGFARLHPDGSLRYTVDSNQPKGQPGNQTILSSPISFNASGLPNWTIPGTRIASLPLLPQQNLSLAVRSGACTPSIPTTQSGLLVVLDAQKNQNAGPHLGAVRPGASQLLWSASPWSNWTVNTTKEVLQVLYAR